MIGRMAALLWAGAAVVTTGPMRPHVLTIPQGDLQHVAENRPMVDISADGRYVAFTSYARLVQADMNGTRDIYVLDRETRSVTLESLAFDGIAGTDHDKPDLSADGRYLVFETHVSGRGDEPAQIVIRDRHMTTARILSRTVGGHPANGASRSPSISADGRRVAFSSSATNLVPGSDPNGPLEDIFLADVASGTVRRIGWPAGIIAGWSVRPSISDTGRYVAFVSPAGAVPDVYVHDVERGATERVSISPGGGRANGASWAPAISGDGRYIAFASVATNLVGGDRNQVQDVFVTDWRAGSTQLVSRGADGRSANDASCGPAISADGRFVAFQSEASNLICSRRCADGMGDINLLWDVFLWDRMTRATVRMSADETGAWMEASVGTALDASASVVAFSSRHPINRADRRNDFDLFVVTRSQQGGGVP